MKFPKLLVVVVACCCFCLSANAGTSIKGLSIGDSEESVKKYMAEQKMTFSHYAGEIAVYNRGFHSELTIAGAEVNQITATFDRGKRLGSFSFVLNKGNADVVIRAVELKFSNDKQENEDGSNDVRKYVETADAKIVIFADKVGEAKIQICVAGKAFEKEQSEDADERYQKMLKDI